MTFQTQYSTYEVDFALRRIRRISGHNPPTSRQPEDGIWRDFVGITTIEEGRSVYIAWDIEDNLLKGTLTSEVIAILN